MFKMFLMIFVANGLLVGMASWVLYHCINMAIYGRLDIGEPNKNILYIEILVVSLIIILGTVNIYRYIKRLKPRRDISENI